MEPKLLAEWFWTDRWMGSSAFLLPLEARGLYREMLTQAWRRGARLPNDPQAIQRAVGCTHDEWDRCWPRVQRYWRVDGDDLVNETQLEIYAETQRLRLVRAKAGRIGAEARWNGNRNGNRNADAIANGMANGMAKPCPPSPSPSPSPDQSPGREDRFRRDAEKPRRSATAPAPKTLPPSQPEVREPDEVLGADPPLLLFPVDGVKARGKHANQTHWPLTQALVDEWVGVYKTVDVLDECRKALDWVKANSHRQKTFDGMRAFLSSWLARSVNMRRGPTVIGGSLKTAGNAAALNEFLRRRGHAVD